MGEKKRSVEPMADQVVLQKVAGQKKTDGGILIPESTQKWINEYLVIDAGSDVASVGSGDTVVCSDLEGCPEVAVGQDTYVVVKMDKIVAKIVLS